MHRSVEVKQPTRVNPAWLAVPLVLFALISLTIGLVAHRTIRPAVPTPFFHLFFSDTLHMKVWLASAAAALAICQVITATRIYGLLRLPPQGNLYNVIHRWSGRAAIALSLPVAYHCIFLLGFGAYDTRVLVHSLLGSSVYGTFVAKVVIVRSTRFPGWALPVAGSLMFTILLGVWFTSAFWFFGANGIAL